MHAPKKLKRGVWACIKFGVHENRRRSRDKKGWKIYKIQVDVYIHTAPDVSGVPDVQWASQACFDWG